MLKTVRIFKRKTREIIKKKKLEREKLIDKEKTERKTTEYFLKT